MKRRIVLPMLIGLVFAVTAGAGEAKAGAFSRLRRSKPACCKPAKPAPQCCTYGKSWSTYPRGVQDFGKIPPYYN